MMELVIVVCTLCVLSCQMYVCLLFIYSCIMYIINIYLYTFTYYLVTENVQISVFVVVIVVMEEIILSFIVWYVHI